MVALKHSEGIKHKVLFQQQKLYKINKKLNTRPLSFSSVYFFSILYISHTLIIAPIYTQIENKKKS
jgi:hypothetical protein